MTGPPLLSTAMTGRVLCIHGVAPRVDRQRFLHRNLIAASVLQDCLSRAEPFVPLDCALAGRGVALTIDDATRAAADAALMARHLGHAVTLFVNPGQIESGAPYHFLLLNALLDRLDGGTVEFERTTFPVADTDQRQMLRRAIKARLRGLTSEDDRRELVLQLAQQWTLGALDVGAPFATLTRADLKALSSAGVDLQNHGWTHAHHPALTPERSAQEIREGREWLRRELGTDAKWFAAPFGDALPHAIAMDCDAWLSFNGEWKEGWIAPGVYNRGELALPPRGAMPMGQRVGTALRGIAARVSRMMRR